MWRLNRQCESCGNIETELHTASALKYLYNDDAVDKMKAIKIRWYGTCETCKEQGCTGEQEKMMWVVPDGCLRVDDGDIL